MNLRTYIDLYALLEKRTGDRQTRRAFGLEHEKLKHDPAGQLSAWTVQNREKLTAPRLSDRIDLMLYHVTLVLVVIAFVLGVFSGIGLLSYSGKEPVNLIYFLAMVVAFPLVTMTLTLFAMLRANRTKNLLVHISPAYWMERLVALFSKKEERLFDDFSFNPRVLNWMVIRRSQMLALAFSLGLLAALLGVVATRDIAFAWSTTLDLSDAQFHTFLEALAWPWRSWLPSAVPSLELVAQSHYYRLGGHLSEEMVSNAALLGIWWKFLAMATLFYAVILRTLFYVAATVGLKRAIKEAMLTLEGAALLLRDMNEPLVTTHSDEAERPFVQTDTDYPRLIHTLEKVYNSIQGWSLPEEMLRTFSDAFLVKGLVYVEAGGNNTLAKDEKIIEESRGSVLLFVKAWEPPTMDFVDYLEALSSHADRVVVVPVGTIEASLKPSQKQFEVWLRKIAALNRENIWIKQ